MKPPKKGSFLDGNRLQAAYWLNAIVGKFAYWLNAIVGKFAYWLNAIVSESAYWLNAILFHDFRLAQRYSFGLKMARILSQKTVLGIGNGSKFCWKRPEILSVMPRTALPAEISDWLNAIVL